MYWIQMLSIFKIQNCLLSLDVKNGEVHYKQKEQSTSKAHCPLSGAVHLDLQLFKLIEIGPGEICHKVISGSQLKLKLEELTIWPRPFIHQLTVSNYFREENMDGMVFVKLVYALAHLVERRSAPNEVSPE